MPRALLRQSLSGSWAVVDPATSYTRFVSKDTMSSLVLLATAIGCHCLWWSNWAARGATDEEWTETIDNRDYRDYRDYRDHAGRKSSRRVMPNFAKSGLKVMQVKDFSWRMPIAFGRMQMHTDVEPWRRGGLCRNDLRFALNLPTLANPEHINATHTHTHRHRHTHTHTHINIYIYTHTLLRFSCKQTSKQTNENKHKHHVRHADKK